MSRRKDRERFQRMKLINPDYHGYRGPGEEILPPIVQTKPVTCTRCRRKRNAPASITPEEEKVFICANCREELAELERSG